MAINILRGADKMAPLFYVGDGGLGLKMVAEVMNHSASEPTQHKPTLRVLDVLETLARHPEGCTLTNLAIETGVSKSTLSPIVRTLERRHFTSLDPSSGVYTIGIKCFSIGSAFVADQSLVALLQEEMEHTVAECQETCQLGVLDGDAVFYIAKVDSPQAIRLISSIGKHIPAYCTALGKALLSDMNIEQIRSLYPDDFKSFTPNTICDVDALYAAILEQKKVDVYKEYEESSENVICFSVPLRQDNRIIAAVSIAVPKFRLNLEKERQVISALEDYRLKAEGIINSYPKNENLLLG